MTLTEAHKRTITRVLLWVFSLAWAFDFKASVDEGSLSGSLAQFVFLGMALGAGFAAIALNAKMLVVRPGVWLLLLWWGFIGYIAVASVAQGVMFSHFARVLMPYLMLALGISVAHVSACRGIRAMEIVAPMILAGTLNVVWRLFYGFAFKGATLDTVRLEVFSPAMNPLFAYLGCAFFLRPRFHWVNLVVAVVAVGGMMICVTRALIFPIMASTVLGIGFLFLGLKWRVFENSQLPRKMALFGGLAGFGVLVLAVVAVTVPVIIERWTERLFHHAGGATSKDLSWLTREAEAKAMWLLLTEDPLRLICGKGMGADYYWHDSYWPELWVVYPADYDFSTAIWFNGHSVWTYTVFSGGIVGLLFHLGLFAGAIVFGLAAVRSQRGRPDPDTWLGFIPIFAVIALLSESATSNQLSERLTGVMLGIAIGAPQALFIRSWQREREDVLAVEPLAATDSHPDGNPAFPSAQ